jgi:hypothetical protein
MKLNYEFLSELFGSDSMAGLYEYEFGNRNVSAKALREYTALLMGFADEEFPEEGRFKLSTQEGRETFWDEYDVESWLESFCCDEDDDYVGESVENWLSCICNCHTEFMTHDYLNPKRPLKGFLMFSDDSVLGLKHLTLSQDGDKYIMTIKDKVSGEVSSVEYDDFLDAIDVYNKIRFGR